MAMVVYLQNYNMGLETFKAFCVLLVLVLLLNGSFTLSSKLLTPNLLTLMDLNGLSIHVFRLLFSFI